MVFVLPTIPLHYFLESKSGNTSVGSGPAVPPAGNQLEKKEIVIPASVPSGLGGQYKRKPAELNAIVRFRTNHLSNSQTILSIINQPSLSVR